MILWLLLLLLAVGAIAAVAMGDAGTIAGIGTDVIVTAVASVALLIFLAGGAVRGSAGRLIGAVKDLAVWAGIGLVLIIGYSFRDDLEPLYRRVAGELLPPGTAVNLAREASGERAVRIRRRADGHFIVDAGVNGRSITMLVDTGASKVVLTSEDARKAGVDVGRLDFSIPVQTANGTGFAAITTLESVAVGGIARGRIEALVAKPGALSESLLGMNFLKELRSYEFSGDFLTIRG